MSILPFSLGVIWLRSHQGSPAELGTLCNRTHEVPGGWGGAAAQPLRPFSVPGTPKPPEPETDPCPHPTPHRAFVQAQPDRSPSCPVPEWAGARPGAAVWPCPGPASIVHTPRGALGGARSETLGALTSARSWRSVASKPRLSPSPKAAHASRRAELRLLSSDGKLL